MPFSSTDIPALDGRVAVVTGANSGLGLETARLLAAAGATVVMTARSQAKHDKAAADIVAGAPDAKLEFQQLDLADLSSVADAAAKLVANHPTIDILVNNAGIMMTPEATTVDGLELQLGTNHFGHFALTGRLLPSLLAADNPRVVTVASGAHHTGDMDFDDLHQQASDGYSTTAQYGRSKLANVLFFRELDRRATAAGVGLTSVGAHPGYTATNLQSAGVEMEGRGITHRIAGLAMKVLNPLVAMSVEKGALPQVYAAVADVPGGSYWGPQGPMEMRGPVGRAKINPKGKDEAVQARLWDVSVEATGVDYAELNA